MDANPYVDPFDRDAADNQGYLYTTNIRLSSQLATQRTTDTILGMERFEGRSVLDIGCGDGYYTCQFWDHGHPSKLIGIDMAENAIARANERKGERPIAFEVGDAHNLPYPDNSFDLILIQSILHHDYDPAGIIREAFRVAPEILIHEPNGNNPGLKIIERVSPYHREHGEKSYSLQRMTRWVEQSNGRVTSHKFAGFVPMFSPDWLAKLMKKAEFIVEGVPLLNRFGCAVYALVAVRSDTATE